MQRCLQKITTISLLTICCTFLYYSRVATREGVSVVGSVQNENDDRNPHYMNATLFARTPGVWTWKTEKKTYQIDRWTQNFNGSKWILGAQELQDATKTPELQNSFARHTCEDFAAFAIFSEIPQAPSATLIEENVCIGNITHISDTSSTCVVFVRSVPDVEGQPAHFRSLCGIFEVSSRLTISTKRMPQNSMLLAIEI